MKIFYPLGLIICCLLQPSLRSFSQSLVAVGNTNFPVNDNTSSAPVAAINGGWQVNGIGKVIKIVPHPSIATTLYACSASGGIFVTANSGSSWAPVAGSFMPGVQFGCLAIDPVNPLVMYAGSGEPSYAQTYGWGGYGVFKTTNGGSSWTQVNNTMGNTVVSDIIINPFNTQEVVACCTNGFYKSTNGSATWAVALAAPSQWIEQVLRQGTGLNLVAVGNTKFYRSTDFGGSWTATDPDPAFSSTFTNGRIAVAPGNSQVVYAGWVNNTFSTSSNASIYYSADGGVTFTKKHAFTDAPKLLSYDGVSTTGYGWANFFITVSPTDPNTLFTGGHLIYKSANNGVSWTATLPQWWCCVHTDIHQLIYDPNNSARIFSANDGGVFVSSDGTFSWSQSSDGLYCNQYESMGQSNLDPGFVIGGLQDNGIIYNNTDGNYHTYSGGDYSDHMTCDYTNAYNVYTSNAGGKVFNPYNRSQSAGLNLPASVASGSRQSFFISALNPAIAYGWGTNIFRSGNINSYDLAAGTSSVAWTQISSFGNTIRDVVTSPASDDVLYALASNATMYKSVNATTAAPTFSAVALPSGAFTNVAGSAAVSKLNPNVLYITANNEVYRSTDAGTTWRNYTATGLPSINFQKIYIDPFSSIESVYLVTSLGVYYRDLTMATWLNVNPSLAITTPPQNGTANYAGLIVGTSLYKGAGSSSSHISFATWGSGIWKATFYNQLNNALPAGYSNTDIGLPAIAGSGFYDNTRHTYNVNGAGTGINNSAEDQFNYTKAVVTGNSDITARIYSVSETDATNGLSKTGLMLRASADANAPYAMIALSGHAGPLFQYRTNAGDIATVTAVSPVPPVAYPYWARLNKNGNVITAYISPDGAAWTQAGQATVNVGTNFLAGIANTANNEGLVNKASAGDINLNSFSILAIQNLQLHAALTQQNQVELTWSFSSDESDNNIVLEKSADGINFTAVSQKNYRNNTAAIKTFNDLVVDANPYRGASYYRLRLILLSGQVKYSNIESVSVKEPFAIKVEPNPVKSTGKINIVVSGATQKITFIMYDLTGRKVLSQILSGNGINPVNKQLIPGTYLYRAVSGSSVAAGKLVVVN